MSRHACLLCHMPRALLQVCRAHPANHSRWQPAAAVWTYTQIHTRHHALGASQGAGSSQLDTADSELVLIAPTPAALEQLAVCTAADVAAGDCYLLNGPVGAGKSVFSRAFIRAAAGDPQLTVPSPTFLLQQVYDEHPGPTIHHYDLYRITPADSTARLDLGAAFTRAVTLVEWPDRLLAEQVPETATNITLQVLDMTAADMAAAISGSSTSADTQSSSSSSSSRTAGQALSQPPPAGPQWSELDDDGGGESDEEEGAYLDQRCRRVVLSGRGSRTRQLLMRLMQQLQLVPAPPPLAGAHIIVDGGVS